MIRIRGLKHCTIWYNSRKPLSPIKDVMELLILKSGTDYIRLKDEGPVMVQLDKASVFPMGKINMVKTHKADLIASGFKNVSIRKLILTEEDV